MERRGITADNMGKGVVPLTVWGRGSATGYGGRVAPLAMGRKCFYFYPEGGACTPDTMVGRLGNIDVLGEGLVTLTLWGKAW